MNKYKLKVNKDAILSLVKECKVSKKYKSIADLIEQIYSEDNEGVRHIIHNRVKKGQINE